MISRAEIAALTPKGRTALFIDLSEVIFPTQEGCATGLEVTRRTIQNWRTSDGVPLMALYALHSMAEAKLGAELAGVVAGLERIALILQSLISAAPALPGNAGTTASASPAGAGSGRSGPA